MVSAAPPAGPGSLMPFACHFLDWSEPALPAAAQWLAARYGREGQLDLSGAIVVLPGTRAGRRLLELLVSLADTLKLVLTPPTITTEHYLPELLYTPKQPFASPLAQQLAWAAALRETPPTWRSAFLPHPPAEDDTARWLELGELLRGLHLELAAEGFDFGDVLKAGDQIEGFAEHKRWQALAEVREHYLRKLDDLMLWDKQTARLEAIKRREPATERDIILIGTVDLNRAQRRLLELVSDRVTALVVAPPTAQEQFDAHGCLAIDRWISAELPIQDEQIERVDGPADQAEAVTRWIASLGGRYQAEQVVVGVPDQQLAPQLARQLAQCGAATRWVEAQTLGETGPFRLLQFAARLGDRQRFADLAALARHADLYDWLLGQIDVKLLAGSDLLTVLDEFAAEQVPASVDAERLGHGDDWVALRQIYAAMESFRQPLAGDRLPLGEWASRFRQLLLAVYGSRQLDRHIPRDRVLIESLGQIRDALAGLADLPESLVLKVSSREAFQLAVAPFAKDAIPPPAAADVVELLGWLELPLDDAPALVVTTFNEGYVPQAAGVELFLPNRLRAKLGLLHNDRRLARDAYALSVLLHSRKELRLIVAKRDADGNPLAPSRLLFAAGEETIARRALAMFDKPPPAAPRRNLLAPSGKIRAASAIAIPTPLAPAEPPERISVTAFKSYLACPYRYYLRHVVKLEATSDAASELDPAAFGNLLHDVLQRFGRSDEGAEPRGSADPERIYGWLSEQLNLLAGARFGLKQCRPAVRVQVEQARFRLREFSNWQARRTQSGWRIVHSEDTEKQLQVAFDVDRRPIQLHGRIDRIDFHEPSRKLAILDYKTADAGNEPKRAHFQGKQWIDLQLPLYRHLIHGAKLPGVQIDQCRLDLGYILLPKDVRSVGDVIAQWEAAELAEADEVAREVVRKIRQGVFEPLASPPPAFSEEFAAICQDNRLGSWHRAEEGDAP